MNFRCSRAMVGMLYAVTLAAMSVSAEAAKAGSGGGVSNGGYAGGGSSMMPNSQRTGGYSYAHQNRSGANDNEYRYQHRHQHQHRIQSGKETGAAYTERRQYSDFQGWLNQGQSKDSARHPQQARSMNQQGF